MATEYPSNFGEKAPCGACGGGHYTHDCPERPTCPKCEDDGYLDDSTQTFPHYCNCPAGERERAGVPFAGRDGGL